MSDYHQYVTSLALQKAAAWAFAIGERPRLPEKHQQRRPHRGMLPDVDFSRAVPAVRNPGPIARLFRRIFGRRRNEQAPAEAPGGMEGSHAALGETRGKPYVWMVEAESAASASESSGPDEFEPAVEYNGSRAA